MTFTFEKLLADVMARLGETARPQSQTSHIEVPWPEDIIAIKLRSLLPEVGSRLIREAPLDLILDCCYSPPSGGRGASGWGASFQLLPCALYAAEVRLPEGFLRFVSVKMSGWKRSVGSLTLPDSPEWCRQWSSEPGVAGCPDRPRAYLDSDAEGRLLRLVGSDTSADTLEWLHIWTLPTLSSDGEFDFPALLYPSLVNTSASTL